MIKVTEDKLIAFELFLSHQKCGKNSAFEAFTSPQTCFEDKAVFELLESDNCADAIRSLVLKTN